jgi:hypothetical protein
MAMHQVVLMVIPGRNQLPQSGSTGSIIAYINPVKNYHIYNLMDLAYPRRRLDAELLTMQSIANITSHLKASKRIRTSPLTNSQLSKISIEL